VTARIVIGNRTTPVNGDGLTKARVSAQGTLWERVADTAPDWLWNGGRPVEDDDLWRKQQAEDAMAGDE